MGSEDNQQRPEDRYGATRLAIKKSLRKEPNGPDESRARVAANAVSPLVESWLSDAFTAGYDQCKQDAEESVGDVADFFEIAIRRIRALQPSKPCPHGDPTCPCPDGDLCHYEGADAWPCDHCQPSKDAEKGDG